MDVARVLYFDNLHDPSNSHVPRWKYIIEHAYEFSRGQKMTQLGVKCA